MMHIAVFGGIRSSMTVKHLMKFNFVTGSLKGPSLACVAWNRV